MLYFRTFPPPDKQGGDLNPGQSSQAQGGSANGQGGRPGVGEQGVLGRGQIEARALCLRGASAAQLWPSAAKWEQGLREARLGLYKRSWRYRAFMSSIPISVREHLTKNYYNTVTPLPLTKNYYNIVTPPAPSVRTHHKRPMGACCVSGPDGSLEADAHLGSGCGTCRPCLTVAGASPGSCPHWSR